MPFRRTVPEPFSVVAAPVKFPPRVAIWPPLMEMTGAVPPGLTVKLFANCTLPVDSDVPNSIGYDASLVTVPTPNALFAVAETLALRAMVMVPE